MDSQVGSVVCTAHLHLRRIAQLRSCLDVGALTTLVHVLVVSRLDYCNVLYVGLPLRLMQKLQMVQNTAARLLTGRKKISSHFPHSGGLTLVAHSFLH